MCVVGLNTVNPKFRDQEKSEKKTRKINSADIVPR